MNDRKRIVLKVMVVVTICMSVLLTTACGSSKKENEPETLPIINVDQMDGIIDLNDTDENIQLETENEEAIGGDFSELLEEFSNENYELPMDIPDN